MRLLFVHQNFPGQYRYLASHFARQRGHEVVALGEKTNLRLPLPGIKTFGYRLEEEAGGFEAPVVRAIRRGRVVAAAALQDAQSRLPSDVVFAHIGWGEALFLKDVFPDAKLLLYCEFFYRARRRRHGLRPGIPGQRDEPAAPARDERAAPHVAGRRRLGAVPTRWQQSQFSAAQRAAHERGARRRRYRFRFSSKNHEY